jgi:hypothetical protein
MDAEVKAGSHRHLRRLELDARADGRGIRLRAEERQDAAGRTLQQLLARRDGQPGLGRRARRFRRCLEGVAPQAEDPELRMVEPGARLLHRPRRVATSATIRNWSTPGTARGISRGANLRRPIARSRCTARIWQEFPVVPLIVRTRRFAGGADIGQGHSLAGGRCMRRACWPVSRRLQAVGSVSTTRFPRRTGASRAVFSFGPTGDCRRTFAKSTSAMRSTGLAQAPDGARGRADDGTLTSRGVDVPGYLRPWLETTATIVEAGRVRP